MKTLPQNQKIRLISAAVLPAFLFFQVGSASPFDFETDFLAAQGYVAGDLNGQTIDGHDWWATSNGAAAIADVNPTSGFVTTGTDFTRDGIYGRAMDLTVDSVTLESEFRLETFTAPSTGSLFFNSVTLNRDDDTEGGIKVGIYYTAFDTSYKLRATVQSVASASGNNEGTDLGAVTRNDAGYDNAGAWQDTLRINTTITRGAGSDDWELTASLFNVTDNTSLINDTILLDGSFELNSAFINDSSLHGGLEFAANAGNPPNSETFAYSINAVPEPGASALLLGLSALAWICAGRRARRS